VILLDAVDNLKYEEQSLITVMRSGG